MNFITFTQCFTVIIFSGGGAIVFNESETTTSAIAFSISHTPGSYTIKRGPTVAFTNVNDTDAFLDNGYINDVVGSGLLAGKGYVYDLIDGPSIQSKTLCTRMSNDFLCCYQRAII